MDILDRQMKIKQFVKTLYSDAVGEGNNLKDNQYIRIYQNNQTETFKNSDIKTNNETNDIKKSKAINIVNFFNNIDDLVSFCGKKSYGLNTYFQLATTKDNTNGKTDNLHTRYFLGFDFDKKDMGEDFSYKDVLEKFKALGIWYHALVDSGHGYHAYMCIEATTDIKKVQEVQKALGKKLGCDDKALLTTQILRMECTYNIKGKAKMVKVIKLFDKNTIKRYSIEKLHSKFCYIHKDMGDRILQNTLKSSYSIKPCIVKILEQGTLKGNRNKDLQKIIVTLKRLNKTLNDIKHVCVEWNNKNGPPLSDMKLEYQTNYMFTNIAKCTYNCKGCNYSQECFDNCQSEFNLTDDEHYGIIIIKDKNAKDLKCKRRKDAKTMKSNELFIYNIILHHEGKKLNFNDITNLITYTHRKKKLGVSVALCEKTLRDTLGSLADKEYILCQKGNTRAGISNIYTVNPIKNNIENQFEMSYFPTLAVIWGIINTEELKLYTWIRYRHNLEIKEGKANGNIFRINQEQLAKDLNLDKSNISRNIKGLIDSKILEIWDVQKNEKGFDYYTYRLVK